MNRANTAIGVVVAICAGVGFYIWWKSRETTGAATEVNQITGATGTIGGLGYKDWYAAYLKSKLPTPLTEAEALLAASRIEILSASFLAPDQEEVAAKAASTRTPAQQTLADKVAIARYTYRRMAIAQGITNEEQISQIQTIAAMAAFKGTSYEVEEKVYREMISGLATSPYVS